MEFGSQRSAHQSEGVKVEKRSESSVGDEDDRRQVQEIVVQELSMTTLEKSTPETGPNASSPTKKEEVDELENAKAEMGEVMKENERLKMSLNRILNEYRTLETQFHNIVEQETKNSSERVVNNNSHKEKIEEYSELVSLSLGRLPSCNSSKTNKASKSVNEEEDKDQGLALGLECKFETSKSGSTTEHLPNPSPAISSEVPKDGESWPPSKEHKSIRDNVEDEVSQQNPAKKARVCVRARCDTPTLNDGCQWRKYGQKISKGNPCPRAYYRCTVAPSCPVRKQVQRCAQDMTILITTYEGTHNHPLPLSATGMASTTSAAASMLLSGSSSTTSHSSSSTIAADLHGMNFYLSDDSKKSKQVYLSHPALSSSPSHPTITLDLTSNPPSSSASFARPFNPQRYPSSTSLNFTSSESNATSWSTNIGLLSYTTQPYNNRNINLGGIRQLPMENIYNSYIQRSNNINPTPTPQPPHSLPDTIAAATKVITADPNFQSALAAALTSIISTGSTQGNQQGENLSQKMKWGELFPSSSALVPSSSKVNGCASSFMNKAPAASSQTGTLKFLQQPLPFPCSKSASGSPADNRDNTN
ncbi:hypothetical protein RJT34_01295 [Clitoria ternatea]|uniref:WRKY domain-containing protein n=1 Tax=Clitoria ternatea TaxID=43366 RepID=A0AAN9Q0G6_CLITE